MGDAGEEAIALQAARRARRAAQRERLRARVGDLISAINRPLAAVIRDQALRYLPPAALLRFRSVHPSWAAVISSPIFAHSQAGSHLSRPSGLFLLDRRHASSSPPRFLPFDPRAHALPFDPPLAFLPSPSSAVRCSTNGLICAVGDHSGGYFICNPVTGRWVRIPGPPRDPGPDPALVLIFDPSHYNFRCDYALVCAFEAGRGTGVYGFETFSSAAGGWWVSGGAAAPAEGLVAGSGVAARGGAYWRTAIGTVVGYDPAADRARVFPCPAAVGWEGEEWWELGGGGGGAALRCVASTEEAAVAYRLGEGDEWAEVGSIPVGAGAGSFRERPRPLRSHGAEMEVVAWVRGDVVAVDVASRRARVIAAAGPRPSPGEAEKSGQATAHAH
ncbi:F-box protein [Ananas comosus]|uniref:F-box protein n=1 Tax=Ananas comosus TaxID=4615 RepID=A0A199V9N0_ANACO|nr:F-box protein [Ananas comosus]